MGTRSTERQLALAVLFSIFAGSGAHATPPDLAYDPPPDQDGISDVSGATPSIEIPIAPGAQASVEVMPVGGSGADPVTDLTTLPCTLGGAAAITRVEPATLQFPGNSTTSKFVVLACAAGTSEATSTLTCAPKRGGASAGIRIWDLACRPGGVARVAVEPSADAQVELATTVPTPVSATVTIGNVGGSPLQLTPAGGLAAPLSASLDASTVQPGQATTLHLSCAATTAGTYFGTLGVTTNDPTSPMLQFRVRCVAVRPPVFEGMPAPPGPLALVVATGSTGSASATIRNAGDAPLVLDSFSGLGSPLGAPVAPITIQPGTQTPLPVTCSPASAGTTTQTLRFVTNEPGSPTREYGVVCDAPAPNAPEFASVPPSRGPIRISAVQGSPWSKALLLRNVGSAVLSITAIAPPVGPQITLVPPAQLPFTIGPGSEVALTVNCSSQAVGTFVGSLSVSTTDSDEGNVPFDVECSVGTGVPVFVGTPAVPGPIQILTLQGTSASASLVVGNVGTGSLAVTGFSGIGPPFSIAPTSATIAPGTSTSFTIGCNAQAPGDFNATLVVALNANPATVAYGLGCRLLPVAPEITLAPAAGGRFAFATTVGQPLTHAIVARNLGNAALTVGASGLSEQLSITPTQATVAAGGSASFTLGCAASRPATLGQTLTLGSNDPDEAVSTYQVDCRVSVQPFLLRTFQTLLQTPATLPPGDGIFRDGLEARN
jgi:hypothetical protein